MSLVSIATRDVKNQEDFFPRGSEVHRTHQYVIAEQIR